MTDSETQQTAFLIASRAANRASNALAEAERTDELTMYLTQRDKWIVQTAPKLAALMRTWSDDAINRTWTDIGGDYKREVWKHMDDELKARIRVLREARAA